MLILSLASLLTACGGSGSSDTQNRPPLAVEDNITAAAGANVSIDVLANDSDKDHDTLTITSVSQALHGTVTLNNNTLRYRGDYTYRGQDSFTYTISDGEYESSASVSVEVLFDELSPASVTSFGGRYGQGVYGGNYLYIPRGSSVSVWDLSDPAIPEEVFTSGQTPVKGIINSLVIAGDHLYAAVAGQKGYLAAFSLSEPAAPALITEVEYAPTQTNLTPSGLLKVADNALYLFDNEHGLFLIDISDPELPSRLLDAELVFPANHIKLYQTQLIASGANLLGKQVITFVDITDIYRPGIINTLITDSDSAAFNQQTLVLAQEQQLEFYDISNVSEPVLTDELPLQEAGFLKLSINNNTAFVHKGDSLDVYDTSGPAKHIKSLPLDSLDVQLQHILTPWGTLFLSNDDKGILVGGEQAEQAQVLSSFTLSGGNNVSDAAFTDETALALQWRYGLTTHQHLDFKQLARLNLAPPAEQGASYSSIKHHEDLAYIADWSSGLVIVDISAPGNPVELARLDLPYVSDLAVDPQEKIALLGQITNGGQLYVVDISAPTAPVLIAQYDFPQVNAIEFYNGKFFVASAKTFGEQVAGLHILDLSAPLQMKQLATYDCGFSVVRLSLSNNLAFLSCPGDARLHILDITQAESPEVKAIFTPSASFSWGATALSNNRVFLGHHLGLDEINIADPAAPRLIKTINLAGGMASKIKVSPSGQLYYLASETNYILRDKE
ncbi:Ig-like domain-containing protein [Thalassomonas haliotis]|uniref:Cadherin-like domain-containing protein n=1 Tax=Thalassomonas haliotis TaxID=485448 RepID=A0ABY7V8K7_9GAMM|nr:Ig-like domain-containing protein [Thalassomonas haliotis]WDE09913.1 cadherin-like domain-containing protein [Thalassomonas haliotis]